MQAMVLEQPRHPLRFRDVGLLPLGPRQIRIKVAACAICRTDLHVCDGELSRPKLPLIPGHEIVGRVVEHGPDAGRFAVGTRVGVPWLGSTCGECKYCTSHAENLCDNGQFTGYTIDGGYAEYTAANENFCYKLPESYSDAQAAPLLCAGLIGYRCWKKAGAAGKLGLFGFGAAAHIVAQVARFRGQAVYAFTRKGDVAAQDFAMSLGATWTGSSEDTPPKKLDAAIIFAPVGALVPQALKHLEKGGTVVCGGIHMSDIPSFPYSLLWNERQICSVANLTREDGREFFALASSTRIETEVHPFPLKDANRALAELREGRFTGAGVLVMRDEQANQ